MAHTPSSDPRVARQYLQTASQLLHTIQEQQLDAIVTAATWIADAIQRSGMLYITGSGHSHMMAEEVFYRAGGLVAVCPVFDDALMLHTNATRSSELERLEGLADIHLRAANLSPNDILIVASNSGRNAFPVEAALTGQEIGCKVIALTSLKHSQQVTSRHSSGKKLYELADLVLDNAVDYGDAAITIPGQRSKVGPLSTVTGAAILNAVTAQVTQFLSERGHHPDVFVSANVDSGENPQPVIDWTYWRQRIKAL